MAEVLQKRIFQLLVCISSIVMGRYLRIQCDAMTSFWQQPSHGFGPGTCWVGDFMFFGGILSAVLVAAITVVDYKEIKKDEEK